MVIHLFFRIVINYHGAKLSHVSLTQSSTTENGRYGLMTMINVVLIYKVAMKSVRLLNKVAIKNVVFLLITVFFFKIMPKCTESVSR